MRYLYRMADGDPLRFDAVCKLNFVFTLSFISFEQENKEIVRNTKAKPTYQI